MSKILISGYYGFANAGDEAMLTAIIESLRQVEKNVELTVLSGNPEDTAAKHQVCSVYRFNPLGIIRAMKDSELIIYDSDLGHIGFRELETIEEELSAFMKNFR